MRANGAEATQERAGATRTLPRRCPHPVLELPPLPRLLGQALWHPSRMPRLVNSFSPDAPLPSQQPCGKRLSSSTVEAPQASGKQLVPITHGLPRLPAGLRPQCSRASAHFHISLLCVWVHVSLGSESCLGHCWTAREKARGCKGQACPLNRRTAPRSAPSLSVSRQIKKPGAGERAAWSQGHPPHTRPWGNRSRTDGKTGSRTNRLREEGSRRPNL